jgi:hypothetical protein
MPSVTSCGRFFRADAAYAIPALYERVGRGRLFLRHPVCLPTPCSGRQKIAHRLTRPVGRPSKTKVKRFYEEFQYQAHPGTSRAVSSPRSNGIRASCSPVMGFIVTNLPMEPD